MFDDPFAPIELPLGQLILAASVWVFGIPQFYLDRIA